MKGILVCFISLLCGVSMHSQMQTLALEDTLFLYSMPYDVAADQESRLNFYALEFPCLKTLSVTESSMPRTDFEILDGYGNGMTYGVKEDMLMIKGFRGGIDLFDKNTDYVQFLGGLTIMDLSDIRKTNTKDDEGFHIEYDVMDLPEPIMVWAQIMGYARLRVKVAVASESIYLGYRDSKYLDERAHEIRTLYSLSIKEIEGKAEEWLPVNPEEVPQNKMYLAPQYTSFRALYTGQVAIPDVIIHEEPELKIEYYSRKKHKLLPECSESSAQLYVYPNPTYGDLNIRMIGQREGRYTLSVYNIIGHKLWSSEFTNGAENTFSWQLPYLDNGVYLYSIKDENGQYVQSRRLTILEH